MVKLLVSAAAALAGIVVGVYGTDPALDEDHGVNALLQPNRRLRGFLNNDDGDDDLRGELHNALLTLGTQRSATVRVGGSVSVLLSLRECTDQIWTFVGQLPDEGVLSLSGSGVLSPLARLEGSHQGDDDTTTNQDGEVDEDEKIRGGNHPQHLFAFRASEVGTVELDFQCGTQDGFKNARFFVTVVDFDDSALPAELVAAFGTSREVRFMDVDEGHASIGITIDVNPDDWNGLSRALTVRKNDGLLFTLEHIASEGYVWFYEPRSEHSPNFPLKFENSDFFPTQGRRKGDGRAAFYFSAAKEGTAEISFVQRNRWGFGPAGKVVTFTLSVLRRP